MNLFPSTDFRQEFEFYPEIAAVVEKGTALLLPMLEPDESVNIKTILCNALVRQRVISLLELMEITDPFSSENPAVNFAIQAAMVNEGLEVIDFQGFSKWHLFDTIGFGSMESRDLWMPLAFKNQYSPMFLRLSEAYSRHELKLAQDPNQSRFSMVKKHGVEALAYVLHKVTLSDPMPMTDVSGNFADEQVFQAILGMNEAWNPAEHDCSEADLVQAIARMRDCGEAQGFFSVNRYFLALLMPICVSVWLSKGLSENKVLDRARQRMKIFVRIAGGSTGYVYWYGRIAAARLLFTRKGMFKDLIEDPYDVLGLPLDVDDEAIMLGNPRERPESIYMRKSPYQMRLLGIQFAEIGVDLGSERAMGRIGFQSVSVEMLGAQSIDASSLVEQYENHAPDLRVPLWVHDGHRFNLALSDRFLASTIKRMDLGINSAVMLGGDRLSSFVVTHSLHEIEIDRLPSFVFALDAVGALDAQMLSDLDLDAEFFGLERIAALSHKGRGAFVTQAIGL
jgi:hypothetical protein